jgi:DNA-binding CsgD family transcriptional regulator
MRTQDRARIILDRLPPLPLADDHWRAVTETLGLSGQLAETAKLMLRDASNEQIATVLGISTGTVDQYQKRITARTGARGRMQLAMRVLAVSHEVGPDRSCHANA